MKGFLMQGAFSELRDGEGLDHGMFPDVHVSQALSSHFICLSSQCLTHLFLYLVTLCDGFEERFQGEFSVTL